jgi:hypothetical protein
MPRTINIQVTQGHIEQALAHFREHGGKRWTDGGCPFTLAFKSALGSALKISVGSTGFAILEGQYQSSWPGGDSFPAVAFRTILEPTFQERVHQWDTTKVLEPFEFELEFMFID